MAPEKSKKSLMDFFGKWPGPKDELDRIEAMLGEERRDFKMRDAEFE